MKKLFKLWYKLTDKDFESKLKKARKTHKHIISSTNGRASHFYNENGTLIRGFLKPAVKFKEGLIHPLQEKYN